MRPTACSIGTASWRPRNASRGVISSGPQGGGGANGAAATGLPIPEAARPPPRSALTSRPAVLSRRLAHPEHRHDDGLAGKLEVDVVLLAQDARDLEAARAGAAHVDRQPQRVVPVHARPPHQPLVEHVEPGKRADLLAHLAQRRRSSRRASSCPCSTAWRRAASSEPDSSALGLVDSTSVTARSTTCSSSSRRERRTDAASPTA